MGNCALSNDLLKLRKLTRILRKHRDLRDEGEKATARWFFHLWACRMELV